MLVQQWLEEACRFLDKKFWNILRYPTQRALAHGFWERWDSEFEGNDAEEKNEKSGGTKSTSPMNKDQTPCLSTLLIVSYSVSVYTCLTKRRG